MKSTVFADPFLLLKMRLQSDTATIRPATSNIATVVNENTMQFPILCTEYFPLMFSLCIYRQATIFFLPLGGKYSQRCRIKRAYCADTPEEKLKCRKFCGIIHLRKPQTMKALNNFLVYLFNSSVFFHASIFTLQMAFWLYNNLNHKTACFHGENQFLL